MTKNCEPLVPGPAFAYHEVELIIGAGIPPNIEAYHREQERLSMPDFKILILKLLSVNGFSTSAVPFGEVTTLDHETAKLVSARWTAVGMKRTP